VATDDEGNIYVVESMYDTLLVYDAAGRLLGRDLDERRPLAAGEDSPRCRLGGGGRGRGDGKPGDACEQRGRAWRKVHGVGLR
jgi:hypothetical protein